MHVLNKIQSDVRQHEPELIAQTNAFLFLYICAFTTLQAPASNNVYCNIIAVVFMLLAGIYCLVDSSGIISPFSVSFAVFTAYVFLSILWSPVKAETTTTAVTLSRLLVLGTLMYNYLDTRRKKEYLLSAFVVAGITVSLVTLYYYGPRNYFKDLSLGIRMGSELYAINYVAFLLVIASLVSIWFVLFRKRWWDVFPAVLCLFISLGTGSRASVLAFCVGALVIVFFRNRGIWRIVAPVILIGLFYLGYKLLELPVFGVLHDRLVSSFAVFKDADMTDTSTAVRIDMIKWGLQQFAKTPVFGMGFSAGGVVMAKHGCELGLYHNTYIEMLAGGGIVGFCLYFFMFFYPLAKLVKPAIDGDDTAIAAVILLITYLVLLVFGSEYFEQATPVVICYSFLTVSDIKRRENGSINSR